MGSDRVRLIIWGAFGCFGFLVFLLILKLLSRLEAASRGDGGGGTAKPRLESVPSQKRKRNPIGLLTERSAAVVPTILRDFSLAKLQEATDHFNAEKLIKIGSSGDLFAGILDEEERVVIKRMTGSSGVEEGKAADQLQAELDIHAAEWSHRRVVPLLGQCVEGEECQKFMVYKFVANGDLASALAKGRRVWSAAAEDEEEGGGGEGGSGSQPLPPSLSWITRLKIATETAEALCHLHFSCHPPVLHKDIKSSSILLTEEFEVRLGSLSYVQKVDNGAFLSYDIFCFGKILLDLISGLDISGSDDPYAEAWLSKALQYIDSGYRDGFIALIDPSLVVEEDFTREILGVAALARTCLDQNCLKSLTMKTVCQILHNPQQLVP
uniref:Protein kinase domain-containing protein n=1 Tax=Araucaria cunninghamii TaxID=56994 RepID=A0A0D6R681_ARACU